MLKLIFVASEKRNMRKGIRYTSRSIQLAGALPLNLSFRREQHCCSTYVQLRPKYNRQCLHFAPIAINCKKHFIEALFTTSEQNIVVCRRVKRQAGKLKITIA